MRRKHSLDHRFIHNESDILKTIAKTANEGIWIIDINGDTVFANDKMAEMVGYTLEEISKTNIYDLLCENSVLDIKKAKVLEDRHEICLKHKNGEQKIFSINGSAFFGDDGMYVGALGMLTDITDIKDSANELKKQKEILRAMLSASDYLLLEKDIIRALSGVVSTIGSRFGADRCFIYGRGIIESLPSLKVLQIASYENKASTITASNYDFFNMVNDSKLFGDVFKVLESDKTYEMIGSEHIEPATTLKKCGVGYAIASPLFINGKLWGFFGISKSLGEEPLAVSQKAALDTISKSVAFTIEKFFVYQQLDNAKLELLSINHNLEAAVSAATQEKVKVEQDSLNKERELYLLREKYHLLQQDDAYKKQIKILRDDLSHKKINDLLFDSFYRPLDILSGDIYGLIKISDGSYFLYLIDAMGKGLSASVTAVISASFINNLAESAVKLENFSIRQTLREYQNFIKKQLNEDEIVCALFMYVDEKAGVMEIANFAMPEIVLQDERGNIKIQKANNYPITSYYDMLNVDTVNYTSIDKILVFSDGLKDARLPDGSIYGENVYEDFKNSETKNIFLKKIFSKIVNPEDDLTFVFIAKFKPKISKKVKLEVLPVIDEMTKAVDESARKILTKYFKDKERIEVESATNELMMNALEHGMLGIKCELKHELLEAHIFEEYVESMISQLVQCDVQTIKMEICEGLIKGHKAVIIKIGDCGSGFDVSLTLKALSLDKNMRFNGRGIIMSDNVLDALFYNDIGNEVTIVKFI
ncbi:MAG: SpoIIE family protein phosphatase [Campylobacterales bacterium]|nr:SpoIIE family protein phosphatase [Campylobacterales bacterium]